MQAPPSRFGFLAGLARAALVVWLAIGGRATAGPGPSARGPATEPDRRAGRPDVILVTADTCRKDRLGAYGAPGPSTPVLDRLARESFVFDRFVSASNNTAVSFSSLMSGVPMRTHGVLYLCHEGFRLADRFTTLPGSALEIDWGTGHDLVLMANFLHHFDRPTCIALLERARAALSAGGRVAVLEPVPDEDRATPPEPAAFDLVMLATTPSGEAYTLREYGGMFAAAGLSPPVHHQIPDAPQLVLVAGAGGDGRSAR